tara:strand:+ start:258 stop:470 length:213 start_codon:yes stop_codon:yes gene_type:complete
MAFKMKGFKPHNMYKTEKANTKADHDRLGKQGYDHSPYNKKGPCWKGYEMIGTKKKGGRTVPNCVPKKRK